MFYKGSHKIIDQAYANMIKGDSFLTRQQFKMAYALYIKAYSILDSLHISKKTVLLKRTLKRLFYASSRTKEKNIFEFYKKVPQKNFNLEATVNYFSRSNYGWV